VDWEVGKRVSVTDLSRWSIAESKAFVVVHILKVDCMHGEMVQEVVNSLGKVVYMRRILHTCDQIACQPEYACLFFVADGVDAGNTLLRGVHSVGSSYRKYHLCHSVVSEGTVQGIAGGLLFGWAVIGRHPLSLAFPLGVLELQL
jgi:hypothetical protein